MDAVAGKVVEEVVSDLFATIKKQFSYLTHYHDNIDNLSKKFGNLEGKRERVQHDVTSAGRKSEVIFDDVTKWLAEVEETKPEIEKLLEDMRNKVGNGCWKGWCLNLKLRYSLSRKAVKKAGDLDSLLARGEFGRVSGGQRPLGVVYEPTDGSVVASNATGSSLMNIASTSAGTCGGLESRRSTMRDIVEALKDDSVRMVRICGMGGVGKTTMAKEVEKRVRDERLFQEIGKAEFTQQPDVGRIQGHLAESVGLELKEEDLSARALRLCERLNDQKKKILLILDNVWKREDLERVGIPLGEEKMNCKILLTSRSEDVCADMIIQKIFRVGVLSDQEARILFQNSVGSSTYARMHQIAEDIVKECGGLPLAISTIGRALANKTKVTWGDVLGQLKKSTLQGEYAAVLNSLQVSYDFVEPEEMKDCFLLCSLFPEGFDVPIEDLVRYGVGLKLFKKIDNVEEARTRAHAHVEKLVNSNLLLVSSLEERVKMHDVVRDFALSTASKGLYMVEHGHGTRGLTEWPVEDTYEHYTSISLQCGEMNELPDGLDCPKLKLLKLFSYNRLPNFTKDFYKGMGALNVLAFSRMFVPLAPNSVQLLSNVRTLSINDIWSPCDISIIANLENLEVLSLAGSNVMQFPRGTGKFSRLRLLDLTNTGIVNGFPPGFLSRLSRLEELYFRHSKYSHWSIWSCKSVEEEKAMIVEIKSLSKLVVLDINIKYDVRLIDFPFENLKRFKISIWSNASEYYPDSRGYKLELQPKHCTYRFQNTLKLICDKSIIVQDGYKAMLRKTEILDLEVKGLETFLKESEKGDCSNLEILSLASCNELVYLINTRQLDQNNVFPNLQSLYLYDLSNFEAIYHVENSKESFSGIEEVELQELPQSLVGPTKHASFGNLRVLDVRRCNKLECIFSLPIARGLLMLERLQIVDCERLIAIFSKERGDEDEKLATVGTIEFPHLKYLELDSLPKLTSLFIEGNTLASDQQVSASARDPLFNQKGPHTAEAFQNLRSIIVRDCSSLRQLFAPSSAFLFGELQNLELRRCETLQAIVATEGEEEEECGVKGILFPQLNCLRLSKLPNLSTLMPKTCTFSWLSLKKLTVADCGGESDLFANMSALQKDTSGQKIALTSLEYMYVSKMNLNMLWRNPFPARCSFQLKKLELSDCDTPTLPHLIQGFDHLEELNLMNFRSMEIAFELEEMTVVGEHRVVPLPRLRRLTVMDMGSMKQVWNIGPHGFQGFQNLTNLTLYSCDSLRYPLSPFIAKYLVKLRSITIMNCKMMEQVLSNRDGEVEDQDINAAADIILLPELEQIWLEDLPSLVCIGPGAFDFDRLSLGAPGIIGTSESTSRHHEVIGCGTLNSSPTSSNEKSSSVASVTLEGIVQRQFPAWSLCYPKNLWVIGCHKMLHVISLNIVARLQKLDYLQVQRCHSVVEIFEVDGMNNIDEERALTIPNLTTMYLWNLPKLMYIWRRRSKLCRVLEFPNLKHVSIDGCDSMRYLFCSLIVTSLVNLEDITVSGCKMMEVIVKEFEDEVEAKGKSDRTTKLVLPRLETIQVVSLPNLKGICLGLLDFELPSLKSVEIKECPEMKIFTTGYSSTPNLERVRINSRDYSLEGDINTVLKHVQDEITKSKDVDEPEDACTSVIPSSD